MNTVEISTVKKEIMVVKTGDQGNTLPGDNLDHLRISRRDSRYDEEERYGSLNIPGGRKNDYLSEEELDQDDQRRDESRRWQEQTEKKEEEFDDGRINSGSN